MELVIKFFKDRLFEKNKKLFFSLNESEKIEYKQSLQLSGESINKSYLKTIAGLANNKGGVIVFGVSPEKNELVGLPEKFDNLDNRYFSTALSDSIDGSIEHSFFTTRFRELIIGFLYIKECICKPVVLKTNIDIAGEKATAGDIYYRYPGRTSRIAYSDLRNILNEEIRNASKRFLNQVEYIVAQGPQNIALLNTLNGELNTENKTNKIIISKEILSEINLIHEGSFVEKDGAPAYIIKGNVEVSDAKVIEKRISIHNSDIFDSFFQQKCDDPIGYIKELLYKDTHFYPIFFFIKSAQISIEQALDLLEGEIESDIKKQTKEKIINRIEKGTEYKKMGKVIYNSLFKGYTFEKSDKDIIEIADFLNLKGNTRVVSVTRSAAFYYMKHQLEIPKNLLKKYIKQVVEAYTHLTEKEIKKNPGYYLQILNILYKNSKNGDTVTKTTYRKAICMYDEMMHK